MIVDFGLGDGVAEALPIRKSAIVVHQSSIDQAPQKARPRT
jgi:hypothetical protein